MDELSTTEAREAFADLVGRVAYGKERVVITRNGKRQAAVIPVEDLERLEALERERGLTAMKALQSAAAKAGKNKLPPSAIREEIRSARRERKKPKPR
jgi:prevent-host-death family protein